MIRVILGFIISTLLSVVLMPFVIKIADKFKAKQPILHYVEKHSAKSGTPTMGGIGILVSACLAFLIFFRGSSSIALVCLTVAFGYGGIGFVDDLLKVHFKHNEGLSAKWKLFLQFIVATVVSLYAYFGSETGGTVKLPFSGASVDFSYFAIAYYVFIFLGYTNAVNLTDGLDGLASSVTIAFLTSFTLLVGVLASFDMTEEQTNQVLLCACFIGALCGFLCYNKFPARIFMGDTGSLALGGLLASISVLSGLSLFSAILGIIYIASALSVIIQVVWYKRTKKRVFLMAPLHHHFEKKGIHENRIVSAYTLVTIIFGAFTILLSLIFR